MAPSNKQQAPERPLAPGTITRLAAQKRDPQRVSVFIDDAFAFGIHVDLVVQFGLSKGMALDVEAQLRIRAAEQARKARDVAMTYLGYRARSEQEVRRKLQQKGFEDTVVDDAVARLHELGYLDDRAYARSYVEARFRSRRYGPRRLRAELRRKGIARNLIDDVLADLKEEEDLLGAARRHAAKRWPRLARESDPFRRRQKLRAYLLRRGFNHDTVRRVIDELEDQV